MRSASRLSTILWIKKAMEEIVARDISWQYIEFLPRTLL